MKKSNRRQFGKLQLPTNNGDRLGTNFVKFVEIVAKFYVVIFAQKYTIWTVLISM